MGEHLKAMTVEFVANHRREQRVLEDAPAQRNDAQPGAFARGGREGDGCVGQAPVD